MCFSPTASFAASVILASIGGATLESVINKRIFSMVFLALIPVLFSIQQFIEGIACLCLQFNDYPSCSMPSTVIYLIFVGIIWPVWFPLTCWFLEEKLVLKKILSLIILAGMVMAFINIVLLFYKDITPKIINHSIYYFSLFPGILIYAPTIILPFLISSARGLWIIGALFAVALAFTFYFFEVTGCSVWCFVSAILSVAIYFIIINLVRKKELS